MSIKITMKTVKPGDESQPPEQAAAERATEMRNTARESDDDFVYGLDREPAPPRFIGGILAPALLVFGAVWFGFIKRRINLPSEIGHRSVNNYFTGVAAVWTGSAVICFAFSLYSMFWAARTSNTPGFWYFLTFAGVGGGVACLVVAGVVN